MIQEVFKLTEDFISQYKERQPEFGPLGFVTYKRSYARPILEENRTEEFWETIQRVVEGVYSIQKDHCKRLRLPWNDNKGQKSAQEMYRLMFEMKFLPPGRGLWMMGVPYLKERGTSAPLYNCSFRSSEDLSIDFAEPFCFLMDMSMLGVGVGFDTKGAGTVKIRDPFKSEKTYVVEDTREAWVDLIRKLLLSFVGKDTLPTVIDFSQIRPYGTPIKGFGGTSSGSGPLIVLAQDIQDILNPLIGQAITSTAIVDLCNAIGRCVVSGNVRRSSEIAIGSPYDKAFLNLKNPDINKEAILKWRWASNNSVECKIGMDYTTLADMTARNGEPGYFWLENAQKYGRMKDPLTNADSKVMGCNPCGEISLESGEFCNVPETFPARHTSLEEYLHTLKFAYLYAKTVTLLPTHNDRVNAVQLRNRRIGMSMSGVVQNIKKRGLREHYRWCDESYKELKRRDDQYSDWLCIPKSIKLTSNKPSGSISLLPGATPGIHFPESEYYYRTMRMDTGSDIVKSLRKAGYRIEEGEGFNTVIVYFPIKEEEFWKSKEEVSMWEQLELAAQMQYYWADNQVSVTIFFKPEEAKDIASALSYYETRLKSVSFLPLLSTEEYTKKGYTHPPYQKISKEEYEKAMKKVKPIKVTSLETEGFSKSFCDGDTCTIA